MNRIKFVKRLLDELGLGGARVNFYECGAAEFNRFLEAVENTMEILKRVGPNPLRY